MNFKNHPKIKKARMGKVVCLIAGVVMLLAALLCFYMQGSIKADKNFD